MVDFAMLAIKYGVVIFTCYSLVRWVRDDRCSIHLFSALIVLCFLGGMEASVAFVTDTPWHYLFTQSSASDLINAFVVGGMFSFLPVLLFAWVGRDLMEVCNLLESDSSSKQEAEHRA